MQIDLDGRWAIGGKIHGGYLLRALAAAVVSDEHPHPLAVSAHFLRAPDAGTAEVKADVLRTGRRVTQSRASLSQADLCIEA
ncbi:MAG TPA: acyl-CoA thioesterase domain-containing protein, partial [Mycobacteriales bacterium]|nr:acyl-CoA thioesterase domain-containing protein [Mycobacteriales bacterium]